MRVEPMTVSELLVRLQTYYGAGAYTADDTDAWMDEYEKKDDMFLGCLFIAIRRLHSKTYKTLPDVAIAIKSMPGAYELYEQVQKAVKPKAIEYEESVSDEEREELAAGLRSLTKKLLSGKGKCQSFKNINDFDSTQN